MLSSIVDSLGQLSLPVIATILLVKAVGPFAGKFRNGRVAPPPPDDGAVIVHLKELRRDSERADNEHRAFLKTSEAQTVVLERIAGLLKDLQEGQSDCAKRRRDKAGGG